MSLQQKNKGFSGAEALRDTNEPKCTVNATTQLLSQQLQICTHWPETLYTQFISFKEKLT